MRPKRSLAKTTLLLLPLQIVFRAGEAVLPLLLAAWFGRSRGMDVYFFAWAVFTFAGSLVFSAFHDSPLQPILAEERLARREQLPELLGSILAHTVVVGSVLAVAMGGFASGWFVLRYEGDDLRLALTMVIPLTLGLVMTALRTFFTAVLVSEHVFFVTPIASAASVVVNVGLLFVFHARLGVGFVPVATLAGELVAVLILAWVAVGAVGVRMRPNLGRPPALAGFTKLAAAQIGGGAVTRLNPVVDQLAAGLSGVVGGGTMLRYAGDVAMLPTSLLQAALLPVLLAHLSDDFARRDLVALRRTVVRALLTVVAILVALSLALHLVREPLLRLVFLRGEMDLEGVRRMANLLPYFVVGLAPFGALLVLARAHVALKNSRIMVSMGILNAGSNLVLNLVLLQFLGLEGIALATSCVQAVVAVVFWFRFEARLRELAREGVGAQGALA